jgi:hypothetical protein
MASGSSANGRDFVVARNDIMIRLLMRNGQRTGAVLNVLLREFENIEISEKGEYSMKVSIQCMQFTCNLCTFE